MTSIIVSFTCCFLSALVASSQHEGPECTSDTCPFSDKSLLQHQHKAETVKKAFTEESKVEEVDGDYYVKFVDVSFPGALLQEDPTAKAPTFCFKSEHIERSVLDESGERHLPQSEGFVSSLGGKLEKKVVAGALDDNITAPLTGTFCCAGYLPKPHEMVEARCELVSSEVLSTMPERVYRAVGPETAENIEDVAEFVRGLSEKVAMLISTDAHNKLMPLLDEQDRKKVLQPIHMNGGISLMMLLADGNTWY